MAKRYRAALWLALLFSVAGRGWAAPDRPVVHMPGVEQGSSVRGDVLLDVIVRPADDGIPLLKADLAVDDIPLLTIDLQPSTRNITFRWATADPQWGDGKHQIVARVVDAKGREGVYRTFVYVWNQGRPTAAKAPAALEVQDADGTPDHVITQKAMIHVKVDPELGAKWVLIYVNDQLLAMLNYPPYQALFDPAARRMDDGPVVVRAKVIHPDNTETSVEPVPLEVNLSGKYTPVPTAGVTPGRTPAVPSPTVATDRPGPASTRPEAAGAPVVAGQVERPQGRTVRPEVIDGGAVSLAVPGDAALAGAGATVPQGPAVALGPEGKPAAARTAVMGPRSPARSSSSPSRDALAVAGTNWSVEPAMGRSMTVVTALPATVREASARVGQGPAVAGQPEVAAAAGLAGQPAAAGGTLQQPAAVRGPVAERQMGPAAGAAPGLEPVAGAGAPSLRNTAVVVTPGRAPAEAVATAVPVPLGTVAGTPVAAAVHPTRSATTANRRGLAAARVVRTTLPAGPLGRVHSVTRGETVSAIARQYGVSASTLARVNNLGNANLIRIGQRLVIPGGAMQVNGQAVKTDVVPVQTRRGIAASPLRYVVEAMGGTVSWVGPARQMVANTADRGVLTITVGSKAAMVNEEQVLMDLAAYLEQGRTMVPVRFISAALDVTIEMDEASGNILVQSNH